jgi:exodeoxyribonuclease VII large subunit
MPVQQVFPQAMGPAIITVSELNHSVAVLFERNLPLCWIRGEISNFTRAASGHWYFTLKDSGAQVRSVMFRGRAQYAGFMPREGDKVEVRATVGLYEPRGDYQINVEALRRAGVGNLFEAFLQLKEKLAAEGAFDASRKRPVPRFVQQIGIVTSLQAAALADVLASLARRAPHVRVVLYPVPVQGTEAAARIVQALILAGRRAECELLLLVRGGGSIEDLWCFNEEIVGRAILASPIPVIAGIGHETDFTIADFCADLRAATPTAAAELAVTASRDWQATVQALGASAQRAMQRCMQQAWQRVDFLARRLQSPAILISRERLKLQALANRLDHAKQAPLLRARQRLTQLANRLNTQIPQTAPQRARLDRLQQAMQHAFALQQQGRRQALEALAAQLELLNPQRTLARGYAIVRDAQGEIVREPQQLNAGTIIELQLSEGNARIGIASVQNMPK